MVFSNPQAVRQIQEGFVPVALKAAHVNNPPQGVEGRLHAEIGRSKPAPQGICVANSAGKVLAWALSFDDKESIPEFLDYAAERYREFPDATKPVVAERFRCFPSHQLPDVPDAGTTITSPLHHAANDRCLGRPAVAPGTLLGHVIGRALDDEGRPVADTLRQEHYMESRFEISAFVQRQFVQALRTADGEEFELPDAVVDAVVGAAYLGQLDVHPLGRVPGSQNDLRIWRFLGRQVAADEGADSIRVRITGRSDVAGGPRTVGIRSDGRMWDHSVHLDWQGYVELTGEQITRLTMLAQGHELLRWGNPRFALNDTADARQLMAGHAIDLDCGVRYGLVAESAAVEK